ncbi:MAG: glycoside hydrolase family 140 protein [Pyrinomonadaceae bacterium]|nr:glycoside hydrolase family 140 protein [Pyrinomonadaceae bacterium]
MIITLRRLNMQTLLIAFVLSGLLMSCGGGKESTPPTPATLYSYPLTMASTSRHLQDQNGKPFLLVGDAAWNLFVNLSKSDADFYLENRKQLGFTGVIVSLIEPLLAANAPQNLHGVAPFTGQAFTTTPNDAYFAHVDYIIKSAAAKGIIILLFPVYLGANCGSQGWCAEVEAATISDMRGWGQYVGNRYKDTDNIIWVIGGDMDPSPVREKVQAVVDGIRSADSRHLFTAHNDVDQMAVTPWPGAAWLNVNTVYTASFTLYESILAARSNFPSKPVFLLESRYENAGLPTPKELRAQSYWTLLSGGFGHVFGNCPLWGFGFAGQFCASTDWKAELNSVGSLNMQHFQALFHSRHWHSLVPDTSHTVLTAGYGTFGDPDYAQAACAADGSSILAYLPSSRPITVTGACLQGDMMIAWWYDPSNGAATQIGTFPSTMPQTFSPPTSGDWVLVVDSSVASFPAPGM